MAKNRNEPEAGAPASAAQNSAIAMLTADHRRVEQLFRQFKTADEATKADLIKQICQELIVHSTLEEEIFYPACEQAFDEDEPIHQAHVEHDAAKLLIAELLNGDGSDVYRDAKVTVLSEMIKHHVGEEEEPTDGIFAKVKRTGIDTTELAEKLGGRKQALQGEAQAGSLEPGPLAALQHLSTFNQNQQQENAMSMSRDRRGRFIRDDDDRRWGSGRREYWGGGGGGQGYQGSRDYDDDERYSRRGSARYDYDDDRRDDRRSRGRYEEDRDEYGRFTGNRGGRYDDDRDQEYRRGSGDYEGYGASSGRGWYGDPRENGDRYQGYREERGGYRGEPRYDRAYDDERRSYWGRDDDDGRGYRGMPSRDERGRFMSADEEDDERSEGRSRGSRSSGRGHGGWFGDARGHAQAARRGWAHRR